MRHLLHLGAAGLIALAACSDRPGPPTDPTAAHPLHPGPAIQAGSAAQARQERLARRLALALAGDSVRQVLHEALAASPDPERKAHFQWVLGTRRGALREAMAGSAAEAEEVRKDALDAGPLEVYLPVPEHRARWAGGPDLLVATAIRDRDVPITFDLRGSRIALDPERPPAQPVLALVPAEQPFRAGYPSVELEDDCASTGCVPGGGVMPASGGLYMTQVSLVSTFEGWLKGNPEFETHVLGQDGSSTALKSYQCAGEHAGGPYVYDQNGKTWSGSVVLFSQAQLDAYKAQHPGQAVRIMVFEDDDGACVIKTEQDRLTELFTTIDQYYGVLTGGRDSVTSISKIFKRAQAFQKIWNAVASFINTNDEIVGTAIEDAVAGVTWPGANWIVKGENNVTNGGIRLEMR